MTRKTSSNPADNNVADFVVSEETYGWYRKTETELAMLASLSGYFLAKLKEENVPSVVSDDLVRMWFGALLTKADDGTE